MNPVAKKIVSRFGGLLWVLALCVHTAAAQTASPLLIVEVSEADHVAAQRLLALTEQPAQLVRLPEAREPGRALALARAAGARQVVIFDQGSERVVVLRSDDGAEWLRSTQGSAATPFVAAFLAVELLTLSQAARPVAPRQAPPPPAFGLDSLSLRVGLEVLTRAPYAGSVRPLLGLIARLGRPRAALSLLLELSLAPGAAQERSLGPGRLALRRTDLSARAGALWQRERLGLAGFAEAGLALTDARYRGTTPAEDHRQALLFGLGAEPSVSLWPWLRLYASARVLAATPRGDYRIAGQSALREPRLGVALGAGLWLTLPIR